MAQAKRAKVPIRAKRARQKESNYNFVSNKKRFILFVACFAVIVILTGIALMNSLEKLSSLAEQKEELVLGRNNLIANNERLVGEAEFTNSLEYVEYMARKLLGWVKPGETKYVEQDTP